MNILKPFKTAYKKTKRAFTKFEKGVQKAEHDTREALIGAYDYAKTTAIGAKEEAEYMDTNTRQVVRDLHAEGEDSEAKND